MGIGIVISFKQYLAEVFDKPLQWKESPAKNISRGTKHSFTFTHNGIVFDVSIAAEQVQDITEYDISLYANGMTFFTGQNQPFKIYATLIDIVNNFFKTHRLKSKDIVYMVSANRATGPIYKRFAKEFAKQHNGDAVPLALHDNSWKVVIR